MLDTPSKLPVTRTYTKKNGSAIVAVTPVASSSCAPLPSSSSLNASTSSTLTILTSTTHLDIVKDALLPATKANIATANINITTLTNTAFHNVKEEVCKSLKVWGKALTRLIGVVIELEAIQSLTPGPLSIADKQRPTPIKNFNKSGRAFQGSVFKDWDQKYGTQLWNWWALLQEEMREVVGTGTNHRPGNVLPNADWTPLLMRGQNGIWVVVVGAILWRKEMEKKPTYYRDDIHSWAEFVLDAEYILELLLDVASTRRSKKPRRH
jgi:hypothetical protein